MNPPTATVRFGDGRRTVAVAVGDGISVDTIAELFRPLVLADDAAAGTPVAFRVRCAPNGFELRVDAEGDAGRTHRFESLPDVLSELEQRVTQAMLASDRAETPLHAAGAVAGGRAIMALGESGAGKSSLALAWSVAGIPLLADDIVFVADGGSVRGLPRLVKVDPDRLRAHGLSVADTVAPGSGESEAWWDPRRGGGWATGSFDAAVVANVRFDVGARRTTLERLSPRVALHSLLEHRMDQRSEAHEVLDRLIALAESALFIEARFGCAINAAQALIDSLPGVQE